MHAIKQFTRHCDSVNRSVGVRDIQLLHLLAIYHENFVFAYSLSLNESYISVIKKPFEDMGA